MADLAELRSRLQGVGQEHLLTFADDLQPERLDHLVSQIESIALDQLPKLIEQYVKQGGAVEVPTDVDPAPYFPKDGTGWDPVGARAKGEELLKAGKVACFTVAGGQGTRLGYDGPKGCYPTGCVTDKSLFQIFAEQVLATGKRYGSTPVWSIMTSPLNHDATVAFFKENRYFGLEADGVRFFQQGVMPAFEMGTGKILLADKATLATAPDGHGGAVRALHESGTLDFLADRGVEHLSYWQVDNPNVKCVDPVFLGLHAAGKGSSGEMSSKMLPKVDPREKVGVFCVSKGKTCVLEYSDLPDELAKAQADDGSLKFIAGSIAIHIIGVDFLKRVATEPRLELPFHRANKKVPHVKIDSGERVEPTEPNGIKLERFIFDAIPLAESSIVYETDRVEEFAPVKNKEGVDSIITSKQLQTERAARWLEACGVEVPRDGSGKPECVIEISPLTALDPQQLKAKAPVTIERGQAVEI
ncbi:MAG: UDPGP type 1 family protein [Planctomycetota bacterium]